MSKKVDTWMPLLVDKYLGDTTHLTTEQHGAYLLLLMAMWKRDGVLPANDQQLSSIARMQPAKWKAAKAVLMEFFDASGDGLGLTQKRLAEELIRSKRNTEKKSVAGVEGAKKRWQKDGGAMADAMADASHTHWQTGASTPPPISPSSISPEDASASSARAEIGKALKRAGIDLARLNLSDPRLHALIAQGATPEEFEGVGREAVERAIAKPLGWICAAIEGRREQAQRIALAPQSAQGDGRKARQLATAALMTGAVRQPAPTQPTEEVFDVAARFIAP